MKILDWDKFALSLYDRRTKQGYRVWVDREKMRPYPELYKWYMRLIPKKELPLDVLLGIILKAGRHVLSSRAITMTQYDDRVKKTDINVCPVCNEAFTAAQGSICRACQGNGYYEDHRAKAVGQ
jgi:formylmethanofuran dehydrogenase subunit E